MSLDHIIDAILVREGSTYTHRPNDRGGPTRYGITQRTLADYRGRPVGADDVHALTEVEARDIYRYVYAIRPGLSRIVSPELQDLAIDCAVNHGPSRAVRMLQSAAGALADGVFGDATDRAVNRGNQDIIYRRLCASRVRLYGEIIRADQSQAEFAAGWLSRVASFIERGALSER